MALFDLNINGKQKQHLMNIKAGDTVRLRLINASASTYFYANLGKLFDFTVIAKDGVEIQPLKVNEILMGIAETYDVIFTMPKLCIFITMMSVQKSMQIRHLQI